MTFFRFLFSQISPKWPLVCNCAPPPPKLLPQAAYTGPPEAGSALSTSLKSFLSNIFAMLLLNEEVKVFES